MGRTKISEEERRKRKRDAERRRRELRRSVPELKAEDQMKRKAKYERDKKEKKVKLIKDMTKREKRYQRKKWRERSKKHYDKKKFYTRLRDDSPDSVASVESEPCAQESTPSPQSIAESPINYPNICDNRPALPPTRNAITERNRESGKKRRKQAREKLRRELLKERQKNESLKRSYEKLRKRLNRMAVQHKPKMKNQQLTPSSEAKVLMRDIKTKEGAHKVRKKLIFSCAIQQQLGENSKKMSKSQKQILAKAIKGDLLKKCGALQHAGKPLSYKMYRSIRQRTSAFVHEQLTRKSAILHNITESSFVSEKKKFPPILPTVKKTMKVHQVTWSRNSESLSFNILSCFQSEFGIRCSHFSTGVIVPVPVQDTLKRTSSRVTPPHQAVSTDGNFQPGHWVATIYGNSWVPGIIEKTDGSLIQVNCLNNNGSNQFFWPDPAVRQNVTSNMILCKINPPRSVFPRLMVIDDAKYLRYLRKNVMLTNFSQH